MKTEKEILDMINRNKLILEDKNINVDYALCLATEINMLEWVLNNE